MDPHVLVDGHWNLHPEGRGGCASAQGASTAQELPRDPCPVVRRADPRKTTLWRGRSLEAEVSREWETLRRCEEPRGDSGVLEPKHIRAALVDQAKVGGL